MFTLPVDREPKQGMPLAGKIAQPPLWNLQVCVEPGVLTNSNQWRPGLDHACFSDPNFCLQIWWANQCLFHSQVNGQRFTFGKNLPDSATAQRQALTIKLQGKPCLPDQQQNVLIKLQVLVEGISIMPLLEDHASYVLDNGQHKIAGEFLGENGKQTLEIYTPIYTWLMAHHNKLNKFAQKT